MRGIVALSCALVLGLGAATAGAEGVVPVEGPWHGTSSAGLPVAFEVTNGQVAATRFRFRWGFCGTYEEGPGAGVPIEAPSAHWRYVSLAGPSLEGTFVAPDRAEGKIDVPGRMLPGCPQTHASFVAEPGAAPFEQAEAVVLANVRSRRLAHSPPRMSLKRDGSFRFYGLRWRDFGKPTAQASGHAYLRSGGVVRRPRATVTLSELTEQGDYRVYLEVHYTLHGKVPPGFRHRGGRWLE
jgi:hypothetical protein